MHNHAIDARVSLQAEAHLSDEEKLQRNLTAQAHSDATVADLHRKNVAVLKELLKDQEGK